VDVNKLILKFIWRFKRLRKTNTILVIEEQSWRTDTIELKTYYKGTIIKTPWYSPKTKQINQWDRKESP
jgi:hypothetical protein